MMSHIAVGVAGWLIGCLFFPMPAFIRAKFEAWGIIKPLAAPKLD